MKLRADAQLPPKLAEWLSKKLHAVFGKTLPDALASLAAGQAIVEGG